jgi:hypothetical protein
MSNIASSSIHQFCAPAFCVTINRNIVNAPSREVGMFVGAEEGNNVGCKVGADVGASVGRKVGMWVGTVVGEDVSIQVPSAIEVGSRSLYPTTHPQMNPWPNTSSTYRILVLSDDGRH